MYKENKNRKEGQPLQCGKRKNGEREAVGSQRIAVYILDYGRKIRNAIGLHLLANVFLLLLLRTSHSLYFSTTAYSWLGLVVIRIQPNRVYTVLSWVESKFEVKFNRNNSIWRWVEPSLATVLSRTKPFVFCFFFKTQFGWLLSLCLLF